VTKRDRQEKPLKLVTMLQKEKDRNRHSRVVKPLLEHLMTSKRKQMPTTKRMLTLISVWLRISLIEKSADV